MQSSSKEIYQITAARTGKDEQLYKDIGNFIQKETAQHLKRPKNLIIKVKGLGFWFLRRARVIKALSWFPKEYEDSGYVEFNPNRPFLKSENKREIYETFKARLADYDKYLAKKAENKKLKDEFKELQKSKEAS
jgi:hypothetical protein